ncbi:hypothetical protein QJS66_15455 [Kocuria rhizophila]|nr:hypothetical protein QJS66_15455 [Kocuria rhizophila]
MLAVVAFVIVSVVAAGGSGQRRRVGLGLIAAGITFIASVVVRHLMLAGEAQRRGAAPGTGVNRSSAKISRRTRLVGRPAGPARAEQGGTASTASTSRSSAACAPDAQVEPGSSAR